ncbi:MAG: hypothetical protein AB1724_18870 [Thermodesulfobacteriota bacterium]
METENKPSSKLKIAILTIAFGAIAVALYPFVVELCYKIFTRIMSGL